MLDWEEGVFKGGRALIDTLWTKRRHKPYFLAEATLASLRMELFYFAHLLAGRKIYLFETEEPVLRIGNRLCLPAAVRQHTEKILNREFYYVKAGLGSFSLREQEALEKLSPSDGMEYLKKNIHSEYPAFFEMWQRQVAALPSHFPSDQHFSVLGLTPETFPEKSGRHSMDEGRDDSDLEKPMAQPTTLEGKGRTQVEVLQGKDLQAPDVPQHTFEKVETLEEFQGLDRQLDGSDDLQDHQQALNELDMRHVLRSKDRAAGFYKADILMSPLELESVGDSPDVGIPYPEWDFRKKAYKEKWCWVQETEWPKRDLAWATTAQAKHRSHVQALKRRLSQFSTDYLRAHAQPLGPELDLQAVVDARIQMRVGHAPSENIYTYRHRDLSDVATLLLVDLSDSTDAWVKGEHVLETLRTALYCLGETLEAFTHSFAIAGFASDTRRACKYFPIQSFDGNWEDSVSKLGALTAQGYTRMGPILRHGTRLLAQRPQRQKALLLMTDGRPCDYDTYEGRYGIQDTKKAFAEAREKGILTHAFAVDAKAREYFPALFMPRQYSVVAHPKDLTEAIFRFFMTLKADMN